MIVAYAKDGVMLATESRGNFYDKRDNAQEPLAFFDNTPKIYIVRNIAFASTGTGILGNVTMEKLFKEFDNALIRTPKVSTVLYEFLEFSRSIMDNNLFSHLCSNKIVAVGKEDDKVIIALFQNNQFGTLMNGHICSDRCDFYYKYDPTLTCEELVKIAEEAIYSYAKTKNMENTIGGDVSALKITETSLDWIQNKPTHKYDFIHEIIKDCKNGNIKYTLTKPSNQGLLDEIFDSVVG
jgi:hypothetical protein